MKNLIHNLIALEEVKHFLRITSGIDDKLIQVLLETAVFHLESYISQSIIQQTYEEQVSGFKETLNHSPVITVESVVDLKGQTVPYELRGDVIEISTDGPVLVKYKAGLFESFIPSEFKTALMLIISALYNSESPNINMVLDQFSSLKKFKL